MRDADSPFKYLLCCRDDAVGEARVAPLVDKKSTTVATAFAQLYASHTRQIRKVRPGNGKEFEGAFQVYARKNGIAIELPVPYRPRTHARAERFHRTLEESVRAMLLRSGLPHAFWPYAAVVFAEHYNRTVVPAGRTCTPFEGVHRRQSILKLLPFGCKIAYLADKVDDGTGRTLANPQRKFAPRGRSGIFLGYGPHKSVIVLDLEHFAREQAKTIRVTQDFKAMPDITYPVAELLKRYRPAADWRFRLPEPATHADATPDAEPTDGDSDAEARAEHHSRCCMCDKFVVLDPPTCRACIDGLPDAGPLRRTRAKRKQTEHLPDARCLLHRCACVDDQGVQIDVCGRPWRGGRRGR